MGFVATAQIVFFTQVSNVFLQTFAATEAGNNTTTRIMVVWTSMSLTSQIFLFSFKTPGSPLTALAHVFEHEHVSQIQSNANHSSQFG